MRSLRALPLVSLLVLLALLPGCSLLERMAVAPPPEDYVAQADGFRYTKSFLTPQEQAVCDQILQGLKDHAPRIEGLYPDNHMIERAVRAIERDYPELFWFSGNGQIETSYLGETSMEAVYVPNYTMDEGLRAEVQERVDQWTADCVAGLSPDASDYEKAIYVYEYVIDHADYQTVDQNSIVNIMVHGAGLCGCYAKTAQYLLNQLGVDCAYVSGQAGGESHAWNLMWLDGTPCWMDPTWGDPVFEGGDPGDGPAYEYFGLTTEELSRTHTLDDVVPVPDCTSRAYNYYGQNGLYLEWYQPEQIVSAMEKAISAGWKKLPLQFDESGYDQAAYVLFQEGQVYLLLGKANEAAGGGLDLSKSVWYTTNDAMNALSIKLPY